MRRKREKRPHRILVTGATEGLGFELALDYATRGHDVIATGSRRLIDDREHFGELGITYVRADQNEPQRAAAAIDGAMERLGWETLDLAILNAGIGHAGRPQDESSGHVRQQIAVNLAAPIAIAHMLARPLFEVQGRLVLIGSTAAKGNAGFATYAATKAALDAFARSLREEWRGRADVLMLHPGPIRTNMHERAGLKLGLVRLFFMKPHRVAGAVSRAIRKGTERKSITRRAAWRAIFSSGREEEL